MDEIDVFQHTFHTIRYPIRSTPQLLEFGGQRVCVSPSASLIA
jgi:hypothetical protein